MIGGNDMTTIELSDEVMRRLRDLATARGTNVAGVLAEAIGLQEAFVQTKRRGGRVLIEDQGKISELSPGTTNGTAALPSTATAQGSGTVAAG